MKESRQQLDAERRQRLSQYAKHPCDPKNAHLPKYLLGKSATDVKEHFENEEGKGNRRKYRKEVYEKTLKNIVAKGDCFIME